MIFLALQQLLARKKQSLAILFGISLGTITYIFVAGMQLGFQDYMIERLVNNDAHIKISAREEPITPQTMTPLLYPESKSTVSWIIPPSGKRNEDHILYPQGWFERLNGEADVLAYSESLVVQVFASRGDTKVTANLTGIDPNKHQRVTAFADYMLAGSFDSIGYSGNKIVVGDGLLDRLGARLNETILLTTGTSEPRPFKVVGVMHLGVHPIDNAMIFGALRDVQQLNGTPGRISHIAVRIDDVTQARTLADQWSALGNDLVQSWDQLNENFLQVFRIQNLFRIFITTSILIVAGFGIYNVLSILVNQKRREIAILRSLGFPPKDILVLFLVQGILLGLLGALLGLLLGYLLCWYITTLDIRMMGQRMMMISFAPSIYVTAFLMAVVSSVIASILPAHSASRMTPIDIIRMEG